MPNAPHRLRRLTPALIPFLTLLLLTACTGGGGGTEPSEPAEPDFVAPKLQKVAFLPQTHGVNYEFLDPHHHPDYISSSDLRMRIDGTLRGEPIRMINDRTPLAASSCNGPCNVKAESGHSLLNCEIAGEAAPGAETRCAVRVLRFAQAGRVEGDMPFEWLITMPDDEDALSGHIETTLDERGRLTYPAKIDLDGRMIITVQPAGSPVPMRLTSRTVPEFRGTVDGWPPFGLKVELTNGPIEYFPIDQVDDPDAKPMFVAETNTVELGDRPNAFFHARPAIEAAKAGDEGVALRWSDSAESVGRVEIAGYNVYRNDTPGHLDGWKKIATVPASTRGFVDREAGEGAREYVVTHFTKFPFGYEYEGLFDQPTRVEIGS